MAVYVPLAQRDIAQDLEEVSEDDVVATPGNFGSAPTNPAFKYLGRNQRFKYDDVPEGVPIQTIDDENREFLLNRNRLFIIAKHFPEQLPDAVRRFATGRLHDAVVMAIVHDVLRKLVREHPRQRTAPILKRVFRGLERGFEQVCGSWMHYYARRLEQLVTLQRHDMRTLFETPVSSS